MLKFQDEIRAFESALPKLLADREGQYVVIYRAEVEDQTFGTYEEALSWGYKQFGLESFYVKQVADSSHTIHFMRGFAE